MKNKIANIYGDYANIFEDNNYILADSSLAFIFPYLNKLDLLTEYTANRELFRRYTDEDNNYNLVKVKRGAWASMVANREKYKRLIEIDELSYTVTNDLQIIKTYGTDTTSESKGEEITTKQSGKDKVSTTYGSQTDTSTSAPRSETMTDFNTTFDTVTEAEVKKRTDSTAQTIDTLSTNEHVDVSERDARTDTTTKGATTNSTTRNAHTDIETRQGLPIEDIITKERALAENINTLRVIVNDTLNFLTYSIYF